MDFSLTEDQEMFRVQVRKMVKSLGGTQLARELISGKKEVVNQVHQNLVELGCTMINIPETYNGIDLEALDLVPTYEELGRALVPNLLLETMSLAVPLLVKYGTDEQKKAYLSAIAMGEKRVTFAALEPYSDFSEEGMQLALENQGEDYVLNGVKTAVPFGEDAESFLVLAKSEKGTTLILVDQNDQMKIKAQSAIDETRQLTQITFHETPVQQKQIIGEVGKGWDYLNEAMLYFNAGLSAYLIGASEAVVDMTSEYAKMREQFGQLIGRFQAVKHGIVNMKVDLEIAHSVSYYANWVLETEEADRIPAIYSARQLATQSLLKSAANSIQFHGGIGFTEELDCQLYLKSGQYFNQYLGSNEDTEEKIAANL